MDLCNLFTCLMLLYFTAKLVVFPTGFLQMIRIFRRRLIAPQKFVFKLINPDSYYKVLFTHFSTFIFCKQVFYVWSHVEDKQYQSEM